MSRKPKLEQVNFRLNQMDRLKLARLSKLWKLPKTAVISKLIRTYV